MKQEGQELQPITDCLFLADSHDVKPISRFGDFLLGVSRTGQTFRCKNRIGYPIRMTWFQSLDGQFSSQFSLE